MIKRLSAVGALALAALVSALPAAAASAPSASTGPVTAIGPTTATVSGSVNPNGAATSWYVEYGTTTSYGSKTSSTSAGSGTSSSSVSANLTGLSPGTSYHYRVVATNSAGTGRGADGLLTTSAAPQVVTGSAGSVTPTSATLNGTVNPSSRATSWYFEYGTSTSYGTKTPTKSAGSGTSAVAVSAQISGLASGRTYHFRLVGTSDAGTSRGNDETFVASAPPTATTKAVSSVRDTTATLNASVSPNGLSTTVYFEYGTSTSYGSKTASKSIGSGTGSTNVSTGVSGLAPGGGYHYRVVATNAAGTSRGGDQAFTTTGRPIVRSGPAAGIGANGATLTGPCAERARHELVLPVRANCELRPADTGAQRRLQRVPSVSEPIGNLSPQQTYHFRLVATNGVGPSYGADVAFTTAGPAVTLAASTATVISRRNLTLSGTVASKRANENVTVFAQRFDRPSFTAIATVLTTSGGAWSLIVRPAIRTAYKGVWNGSTSFTVTVAVRPAVSVRVLSRLRVSTTVLAGRSFAGRTVQLQRRLSSGRWLTIARAQLNRKSSAVFHPTLKRGRWTLRVAISVNQAGSGYLAGFSRQFSVRRLQ